MGEEVIVVADVGTNAIGEGKEEEGGSNTVVCGDLTDEEVKAEIVGSAL